LRSRDDFAKPRRSSWSKNTHDFNDVDYRRILGDEFVDELIRQAHRDGEIERLKKILAFD
jgi:hypothetical protein